MTDESTAERLCVTCGEPIPAARVEAIPGTTTCVACASVPRRTRADLPGRHFVQHTGGLHEKYLHEEDAEMDEKHGELPSGKS
ncbi:MAG TPA: TraR/DksA C4-type zinc finger protein [Polyangia bacterium]|nr:TraR/DksA C4-type zinc finger protein [Polyangia bacterium]